MRKRSHINAIIALTVAILITRLIGYAITLFTEEFAGIVLYLNSPSILFLIVYDIVSSILIVAFSLTLSGLLLGRSKRLSFYGNLKRITPWMFLISSTIELTYIFFPEILNSFIYGLNGMVVVRIYDVVIVFGQIFLPIGIFLTGLYFLQRKATVLFKSSFIIFSVGYFITIFYEFFIQSSLYSGIAENNSLQKNAFLGKLGVVGLIVFMIASLIFVIALLLNLEHSVSTSNNGRNNNSTDDQEDYDMVVIER